MDTPQRLEVNYVVRRWDVLSMYLGSWGARIAAAPGAVIVLMVVLALPSGRISLSEKVTMFGFGLASAILVPLGVVLLLMAQYGTARLVGKEVHLSIDGSGVHGWPLAPYQDRSWPRIRKVRRLRGVITLPFRQFGTRAGWVPVPERALEPEQLAALWDLLVRKGIT